MVFDMDDGLNLMYKSMIWKSQRNDTEMNVTTIVLVIQINEMQILTLQ